MGNISVLSQHFSTKAFLSKKDLLRCGRKPDPVGDNSLEWPPFTAETPKTMKLDLPFELVPDFKAGAIEFWKSLNIRELQFPPFSRQQY